MNDRVWAERLYIFIWNVAMTSMHREKRLKSYEKTSAPCVRQCANNNNNNNDNYRRSSLIYNAWVIREIEKRANEQEIFHFRLRF